MVLGLVLGVLLAAIVGLITYRAGQRQGQVQADVARRGLDETKTALARANADFEARQEELRKAVDEALRPEAGESAAS